MLASHDSTTTTPGVSIPPSDMARWAARLGGGSLAVIGFVAMLANVTFLRALGFGLPALIAGVAMWVLSEAVWRRDRAAAVTSAMIWLLHGGWVVVRVTESGGDPSMGLWITRLLFVAIMVIPAFAVRRNQTREPIRG